MQHNNAHPFARRGLTTQNIPKLDVGKALIDWTAANDLNRVELRVKNEGWNFPIPGFEPLQTDDATRKMRSFAELVDYGHTRGVDVVAAVGCSDGDRRVVKAYPETRVGGVMLHPSGHDHAIDSYCFNHPTVKAIYHAATLALVENSAIKEVQFWLTENNIRCACSACTQGDVVDDFELTRRYFITQAAVMYDAIVAARKIRPELGVSMWTTQGCRYHLDALIRSLPKDVLWFFYDGERYGNYNLRHLPRTIPDEIQQLQREGYRIGVQLDWASCSGFLPVPSTIRERIYEAHRAGVEAVCGWINAESLNLLTPAPGGVEHPTLAYAAWMFAHSDDPRPESLEACMTRAARKGGFDDTAAKLVGRAWRCLDHHARAIHLADCYCFFWYGVNQLSAVLMRIAQRRPVDEIDQRWVDTTWESTLPALDQAVAALDALALELAATPRDIDDYLKRLGQRCVMIAHWARACRHILHAGIVYHRLGSWDTTQGPWRDSGDQMRQSLAEARRSLLEVHSPTFQNRRIARTCELIDQALAAIEQGATPTPITQQDIYPYLSVPAI